MRIVLTGGPCSGKTTIVRELEKKGYNVIHECARKVLEEIPGIKFAELEKEIFRRQFKVESGLNGKLVFLDRGLPDILAYLDIFQPELKKEYNESDFRNRYDKVFILDRLNFQKDDIRYETPEEAQKIHDSLFKEYSKLDYKPIRVPVLPIMQRIDYILDRIK